MSKKYKIIIGAVFILALVVAGFFYYNKAQEDKMGPVSFESFKRTEADGKVFMENKDIGLKFMVPEGWEVKNLTWSSISVASQDFEPFTDPSPLPKKGCLINIDPEIQIEGSEYDLQYTDLKQRIDSGSCSLFNNDNQEKCEIVDFYGLKGVRDSFSENKTENPGFFTNLSIPYNNIIYRFESYIFGENKDACLQEFDNFLKSVSIKKK
ncbi:MAG: hypothetical protein WC468_03195 [Candidatus Paceibacterota bacterium]